jgi:16S rRNA (cytosine967-C5)-methyltransferase
MSKTSREIVLDILLDIDRNDRFAGDALGGALRANQFMNKKERAYISRLTEGVTEQKIRLDYILNQFSKTKIKKCKPVIRCILRMAAYEIFYMDAVPDEAACNEYVNLTGKRGFRTLKGYVNGVLRSVCRNKAAITYPSMEDGVESYLSVKYSVPEELVGFLLKEYSTDQLEQILQAGEQERGTTIRVNTMQTTTEKFRNILIEKGIKVEKGYYNQTSLIISGYDYIRTVPGFHEGLFTVQDESSSLQVLAAGIRSGDVILDVCAAPGGKTMYAAEQTGERGHVYARDISEEKVDKIDENLERLELRNVSTKVWDATVPDPDMIEKADVVLADLPCSGLGVMARKNDIKYHVTEDMVRELAAIQKTILDVCAVYVKPGGALIYSTCTIDRIENEENVTAFLKAHEEYELESLSDYMPECLKKRAEKGYITLLQGVDHCDGFFISRLRRRK